MNRTLARAVQQWGKNTLPRVYPLNGTSFTRDWSSRVKSELIYTVYFSRYFFNVVLVAYVNLFYLVYQHLFQCFHYFHFSSFFESHGAKCRADLWGKRTQEQVSLRLAQRQLPMPEMFWAGQLLKDCQSVGFPNRYRTQVCGGKKKKKTSKNIGLAK